jgi:ketosteroid isomerase-like protein
MNDPDPEIAVVLTAYAAFARGDIDQAIAGLHPHVEWIEPGQFPHGGRRVGPAAVADYLRDSRSLWAELVSEPAATRRETTSSSSTISTAAWPTARSGM